MKLLLLVKKHKIISIVCASVFVAAIATATAITIDSESNGDKAAIINKAASPQSEQPDTKEEKSVTLTVPEPPIPETQTKTGTEQDNIAASSPAEPTSANPYGSNSMLGYIYDRREQAGQTVGGWGMGTSWPKYAREAGAVVDRSPSIGATYVAGLSVYIVEAISEDSITASYYMDGVQTKTISLAEASGGWFIH